jgi:hypothetical protein
MTQRAPAVCPSCAAYGYLNINSTPKMIACQSTTPTETDATTPRMNSS